MATKKIAIVVGSLRKDSFSGKIAKTMIGLAQGKLDMQVVEIRDLLRWYATRHMVDALREKPKDPAVISEIDGIVELGEKPKAGAVRRLDVVVNNAGVITRTHFLELSPEEWRNVIDTDLTACFLVAQQAARREGDDAHDEQAHPHLPMFAGLELAHVGQVLEDVQQHFTWLTQGPAILQALGLGKNVT